MSDQGCNPLTNLYEKFSLHTADYAPKIISRTRGGTTRPKTIEPRRNKHLSELATDSTAALVSEVSAHIVYPPVHP